MLKVIQRVGWVLIALGIVLVVSFVSGLTHPITPQVPSTVASYDSHHRWVVHGFVVSMAGVALLVVTEALRRNQKPKQSSSANTPVE